MKHTFCTILLLFTVFIARAEGTDKNEADDRFPYYICGTVVDENGHPLPGAAVKIEGTTFGAGTNSKGVYTLRVADLKTRTLLVSFTGYESQEVAVTPTEEDTQAKTIRLKPADNQLDEVVVTGSFVERPLKDVPVLTRVISQREIKALNPQSIETLLQYELPGLQIGYNSMSHLPEITYQGMGGEYLLFLVDGERVSGEGADHNVDFTRFNVDDIERIEVIRGSQSTIYGSNALGGVVNIITKNADRPFTGNLSARYAGTNGQKYTASAGVKKNRLTSYTSLTWRQKDTYTISDSEGQMTETGGADGSVTEQQAAPRSTTVYGYNIWDLTQKLGYTCNEKVSAELKGNFYHNRRDVVEGHLYRDFFVDYALGGKVKYLPAEGQQLTLSYLYDNYRKDKDFFEGGTTRTDYRNITQTPRLDYTATFGDHTVSAGFEANLEYLKHYMLADSSHVSNQTYALYLQEDWHITPRLNLVAGLRADYHKRYHLHVTPKLSVLWHVCDLLSLRAGYSQGFRSPSLKELYQAYDMGGMGWMMLYGNPDLTPETSNQWSLSAELNRGGLYASLSASHNRFKDKIALTPLGDGTSDRQYVNADRARTTAVEAIVRYTFGFGLALTGSYAFTDDYEDVEGHNVSMVRPHSVTFNALYNHRFGRIGVNASLNGQWASAFDTYSVDTNDHSYVKEHYGSRTLCSLNAGVSLPRGIALNVGIDNLLNFKDKAYSSGLQVPQRGLSWIGTVNINLADLLGI